MATKPRTATVYGVREVGTTAIRYVGVTTNPIEHRLKQHFSSTTNPALREWINSVRSKGGTVEAIELAKADFIWVDGLRKERHWIYLLSISSGSALLNTMHRADFFPLTQLEADAKNESFRQIRERWYGKPVMRRRGLARSVWVLRSLQGHAPEMLPAKPRKLSRQSA